MSDLILQCGVIRCSSRDANQSEVDEAKVEASSPEAEAKIALFFQPNFSS